MARSHSSSNPMTMQSCYSQQPFEQDESSEDLGDVGVSTAPSKIRSLYEVSKEEATEDNGGAWVEPHGNPGRRAPSIDIGLGLGKSQMRVLSGIQQDPSSPEWRPRKRLRQTGAAIVEDGGPSANGEDREDVKLLGVPLGSGAMRTTRGLCRPQEVEKNISREAVLTTLDKVLLTVISPHGRPDRAQPPAIPLRNMGKVPPCARCKEHRFPRQGRIADHLLCDNCERLFHLTCLLPAEGYSASDDNWQCPMCVASQAAAFEEAMEHAYGLKQPRQTSELLDLSNALQSSLPHLFGTRAPPASGNESGSTAGEAGDASEADGSGVQPRGRGLHSQSWRGDNGLLWGPQLELSSHVRRGSRVGPAYQARVPEGPLTPQERAEDLKSLVHYIAGKQADGEGPSEALSELRGVSLRQQPQRSPSQVPLALPRPQGSHWLQCGRTLYSKGHVLTDGTWVGTDVKCGKWRRAPATEKGCSNWECSAAVKWDPAHADCAVPEEPRESPPPVGHDGSQDAGLAPAQAEREEIVLDE